MTLIRIVKHRHDEQADSQLERPSAQQTNHIRLVINRRDVEYTCERSRLTPQRDTQQQPLHRRIGFGFGLLLGSLAFFVAAIDILDRIATLYSQTLAQVLATMEDSGEMFVVSMTVAFALIVYRRYGPDASQPSSMP